MASAASQWEREKEAAIAQALRSARSKWLEEREASIGSRVEAAVAAAQKMWREHHRRGAEQSKAESVQGSSPPKLEKAVGEAVAQARKEWMQEHSQTLERALRQKQEVCLIVSGFFLFV